MANPTIPLELLRSLVVAGICVAATTLGGCAGLISRLEGGPQAAAEATEGVSYFLPAKVLQADIEFRIVACEEPVEAAGLPRLSFQVRPTIAEHVVPDRAHRYVLRYAALNALTKVTDVKITVLPNGMLGSVNAAVDDRTGAILGSVIDAGAKLVRGGLLMAAGVGAPVPLDLGGTQFRILEQARGRYQGQLLELQNALRSAKPASTEASRLLAAIEAIRQEIAALDKRIAAIETLLGLTAGDGAARHCSTRLRAALAKVSAANSDLLTDEDTQKKRDLERTRLAAAAGNLTEVRLVLRKLVADKATDAEIAEQKEVEKKAMEKFKVINDKLDQLGDGRNAKLRAALAAAQAEVTFTAHAQIEPEAAGGAPKTIRLSDSDMTKLFDARSVIDRCKIGTALECKLAWPQVQIELKPLGADPVVVPGAANPPQPRIEGLYYRQPAFGTLTLCAPDCPADSGTTDGVVLRQPIAMPQWGAVSVLTLKNEFFDNNTLGAVFNADGGLASLNFSAKARAEGASAAAAAGADKYFNLIRDIGKDARDERKSQRDERKAEEDAQLSSTKARLDYLKTLREIELKQAGAVADPVTAEAERLAAERARLQQLIEVMKLRKEVETLRAGN